MTKNSKTTTPRVASLAGKTLSDPRASEIAKSMAGAALAQKGTDKQTSAAMEEKASKVLRSDKYSEVTKSLAGSVVAQANKDR